MQDIDYVGLVRLIRARRGLTQEELARELDVTVGTLNGWENGRHRPLRAQRKRLERMAADHGLEPPVASIATSARRAAAPAVRTRGNRSE